MPFLKSFWDAINTDIDKPFLHPDTGADVGMPYLEKARTELPAYYNPYIERGRGAGDILSGQLDQYSRDPAGVLEGIMAKYQPSKQYNFMRDRMGTDISNTAAAGGYRGSPNEQYQQGELTEGLLSKDMQQYLENVLGIQKTGLTGEEGLYGKGFEASTGLGGDISNIYGSEGTLGFQGQREKNKRAQDILKALMQAFGASQGAGAAV